MKILWKYFKNYRLRAVLAPLFKMLEASFELLIPLVMAAIIDKGIRQQDGHYILRMGLLMVFLGLVGFGCSVTAQYFSALTAMAVGKELRYDLFSHIEDLSYKEIDQVGTSTLVTRMTSDVNQIQTGVNMFLRLFLRSPFIVIGATIMAFTVNKCAGFIFLIALPILILIVFGIMFFSIPLYKKVQSRLDTVTLKTRENLSGARVIRAFSREEVEMDEFGRAAGILTEGQLFVGRVAAFLNPLSYAVINLAIAAIIWQGAKQVDMGLLAQGGVYALVNYMSQILVELVKLANLIIIETKAVACVKRVESVLALERSMKFAGEDSHIKSADELADYMSFDVNQVIGSPKLVFENVGLTYDKASEPSLSGVSFKVYPGETVGIIGGTGSGKSTLVNLIPRFYDCTEGRILIDGKDVKDFGKDELRKKIGVVPQKATLFSGNIASNLRLGNKEATDEELYKALETAQAMEFVREKKGALMYALHHGAKNLSGGQRQRLTIARALVKNPEVLILDDSSSALDYATDAKLRKGIAKNKGNMTVFIVSQRTSSIIHADKIIVLDDGKICGIGNHRSLLKNCEVYQEIYDSQNQGESFEEEAEDEMTATAEQEATQGDGFVMFESKEQNGEQEVAYE